ncbi:hypothetical protein I6F35_33530 [Bradyrhizobium sp. BRP22]|uniref:hypothetical protein n=1 Tax=Bradyrhizobium sp. BRP22 TaxID=2793821 RepID=UPI001CD4071C|nr:hypothetical protein [Bradyrhizobium sp. BRP22]MCA1458057.1 hypothetical protein [Bradyrhizobium sp. BRP22]
MTHHLNKVSGKELENVVAIGDAIYAELQSLPGQKAGAVLTYLVVKTYLSDYCPAHVGGAIETFFEGVRRSISTYLKGQR